LGTVLLSLAAAANVGHDDARAVQNLRAFAKLYGYVRFFHPTDEASAIDWDRFAAYGARRVLGCADAKALRLTLDGLFGPIAPTVKVYGAGAPQRTLKLPGDSATCQAVAWCHLGVSLSDRPSVYESHRTGRPNARDLTKRAVLQELELPPGDSLVERVLRVRVRARTTGSNPGAAPVVLALSYPPDGQLTAFRRTTPMPVSGATWRQYEVEAPIKPDCRTAAIGVSGGTDGDLWADDFEAWVGKSDSWTRLAVKDAGFEDSVSLEQSKDWYYWSPAVKSTDGPFSGRNCLLVSRDTAGPETEPHASPGEYVDKPLAWDLRCRVPLCLWSSDGHTLPRADTRAFGRLKTALDSVSFDTLADPAVEVRLADVIIVWNVMQHFFPYFDVVPTDWDTVLTSALAEALTDTSRLDFLYTLRRMGVPLYDGHVSVNDPVTRTWGMVPALVEVVEGRMVVTAVAGDAGLRQGDVLLGVNGRPATEVYDEQLRFCSGSPQQRRARALRMILRGPKTDTFRVLVERGGDTVRTNGVVVGMQRIYLQPDQGDSIRKLAPGIWYVDLDRAPMAAIDSVMGVLAKAKGVVFDLRGYPNNNHDVISHLLTSKDTDDWMHIAQIVYPDRERIAGWTNYGWHMEPKEPRITGKTVFLTDGTAISYAESFMGYIEGYKLAEIVGQPTAGTNGNVDPIDLPGGYSFSWTGMKVVKHDGSQHHLIGIQPTVPLQRTLKAVREGRDEYIEKAVQIIQQ
jgi:C-terminal processing protease CtpA/Prc